jgi:glyoxylase-like metal-dependent hydrolase (beta-lactamase superfamily II)
MIDDQFAELSDKIRAAVGTVTGEPIRWLVNTHWHGDHTGGNENFSKAGVTVIAQDNVRKTMSAPHEDELFGSENDASPPRALPVLTFPDSVRFHVHDEEIVCYHVPRAHTDGDVIVWMPQSNVVHVGDVFFNGMYPRVDLSSNGSIDGMIAADDRVLRLVRADTRIIAGHGPLASRADLAAFRDMLVQSRDRVRKLVVQKKTLEQIQAAKPLADLDAKWGAGFIKPDRWLEILYADATAPKSKNVSASKPKR